MLSSKYIHINMDKNKRPKLYTLPDTLQALQPRHRPDLPGAVCLASGAACAAVCAVQSFRVRLGLGFPPAGYTAAAQPLPVSRSTTEKIKKALKKSQPDFRPPKIFPKKQKDPYKGFVFCAILALQALKGRNLQWLKVK